MQAIVCFQRSNPSFCVFSLLVCRIKKVNFFLASCSSEAVNSVRVQESEIRAYAWKPFEEAVSLIAPRFENVRLMLRQFNERIQALFVPLSTSEVMEHLMNMEDDFPVGGLDPLLDLGDPAGTIFANGAKT